ncbi:MAG: hypothetical protein ACI8P9_004863 [Parasphingorhabdus sp.]|jgi:hypothetical protein
MGVSVGTAILPEGASTIALVFNPNLSVAGGSASVDGHEGIVIHAPRNIGACPGFWSSLRFLLTAFPIPKVMVK